MPRLLLCWIAVCACALSLLAAVSSALHLPHALAFALALTVAVAVGTGVWRGTGTLACSDLWPPLLRHLVGLPVLWAVRALAVLSVISAAGDLQSLTLSWFGWGEPGESVQSGVWLLMFALSTPFWSGLDAA